MPLSEYAAPAITDDYLKKLSLEQMVELLNQKTNGLIVASRIHMLNSDAARTLKDEVQKLQDAVRKRIKRAEPE
jgi:hypothetical protein